MKKPISYRSGEYVGGLLRGFVDEFQRCGGAKGMLLLSGRCVIFSFFGVGCVAIGLERIVSGDLVAGAIIATCGAYFAWKWMPNW